MADMSPSDGNRRAGRKGNKRSGKVADFRYKSSPPPAKSNQERRKGRADAPYGVQGRGKNAPAARKGSEQQPGKRQFGRGNQPQCSGNTPNGDARKPSPRYRQAYAALDLGTNNCRLLIARPSGENFTVIDAFSRVVKLGEGLAHSGRLSDAAMDRTLAALKVCSEKLRRRNVHLARSVATEACRRAENGEAFIARVREETGIMLDIITAQEEARLAVLGCHILLEQGHGRAVIFDIGGGSTELVLIEPDGRAVPRILDWQSVPWGVVSLNDMVGKTGTGPEARLARYAEMRRVVSESFAPFAQRVADAAREPDIRLLGTSGTVTTLASLHLELPAYDRRAVDGLILPATAMRDVSTRLSSMSMDERSTLPCIGQDRAELVVAGCAILESILDLWPAEKLGVADRGIREGILRSLMAGDFADARDRKQMDSARTQTQ